MKQRLLISCLVAGLTLCSVSRIGFPQQFLHKEGISQQNKARAQITWHNLSFRGGCGLGSMLLVAQLAAIQNDVAACLPSRGRATIQLTVRGTTPENITVTPANVSACILRALSRVSWPNSSGSQGCAMSFQARKTN